MDRVIAMLSPISETSSERRKRRRLHARSAKSPNRRNNESGKTTLLVVAHARPAHAIATSMHMAAKPIRAYVKAVMDT